MLYGILSRFAVPLFFISSGYFWGRNIFNSTNPLSSFRKNIKKLITLYLTWVLVYLPLRWWTYGRGKPVTLEGILVYLKDILFYEPYYHLWYMNALIFSLATAYILKRWLSSKQIFIGTAFLYLIGSIGNVYYRILPENGFLQRVYQLYFSFFKTTRNGLFFGLFFVVMGIFIYENQYRLTFKLHWFLLSLFLFLLEPLVLYSSDSLYNVDMYIFLAPMVFNLFLLVLKTDISISEVTASRFRDFSSTIYFIHPMMDFIVIQADLYITGESSGFNLIKFLIVTLFSILIACIFHSISRKSTET